MNRASELQILVDDMSTPGIDGTWTLDHERADDFVNMISNYVKKSAYKSDKFDPEDACAEITWNLWKVLEKHGPRPYGNPWSRILKLKTLNVLTSRARKRASETDKINFQCEAFDGYDTPAHQHDFLQLSRFPDPFNLCLIKERIEKELGLIKNGLKEDNMSAAIRLKDCKIGGEYYTKMGKKVQLLELSGSQAKILLLVSETTIPISANYQVFKSVEDFQEYFDEKEKEAESKNPEKEEVKEDKVKVRAKDVIGNSKKKKEKEKPEKKAKPKTKTKTKSAKKDKKSNKKEGGSGEMKKNTAKQLVLSLLKKGPHTRDELAKAVIAKGLTENTEIKKVKHYISVMLANAKKKDKIKIVTLEPGKYAIEE
ncbi:MAG: hypothetical protein NWE80_01565 [Candidatus Bathyarchaeota archaeon]|nr:hypothetical protein [Candidatus Bathyarchaeota archaeon]